MRSLRVLALSALCIWPAASQQPPAVFEKPFPADQLEFLNQFAGAQSGDLIRDKQFRKLMHAALPDCMFHYGHDMPLTEAIHTVINGSTIPVRIRDGRYLTLSGHSGPYLAGRGFIWIDLQDGIVLGGFYFHPTNGEPTPAVNVFSRQVKEDSSVKSLNITQLRKPFIDDLNLWSAESRVPPITTRYFITGSNKKILLEHDEDYCAVPPGAPAPPVTVCERMNADAADIDLTAAYYLEQTGHATNSTAWMIGPDQVAWLRFRDTTCSAGPDLLGCRIRLTREHTRVIIGRTSVPHR